MVHCIVAFLTSYRAAAQLCNFAEHFCLPQHSPFHCRNEFSRFAQFIQQTRIELPLCPQAPGGLIFNSREEDTVLTCKALKVKKRIYTCKSWSSWKGYGLCDSMCKVQQEISMLFCILQDHMTLNQDKPGDKSGLYIMWSFWISESTLANGKKSYLP